MTPVSVIVNTLNRAASLKVTLESLRRLTYPHFEVIVVNGPSADGTEGVLAEFAPSIRIGRCAEANLSMSRNVGLQLASGELVAFIDDDAVPYERWLDDLVPHFDTPEVAGAGGFVFDHTGFGFQHCYTAMDRAGTGMPLEKQPDDYCYPGSPLTPFLLGTNALFRRDVVIEVGGFDEEYEYFYDEVDLCTRMIDAGYLIRQRSRGFVYHGCLPSHNRNGDRIPTNWFPILKNKVYYSIRNGGRSFSDAATEAVRRAEEVEQFLRGRLPDEEIERFKAGVPDAIRAGMESAKRPGRRLAKLRRERGDLKPYPRLAPEPRLTACIFANEPGAEALEMARSLGCAGHIVHVLAQAAESANRVEYTDGVWIHRSESVEQEFERVRDMYGLPVLRVSLSASA